MNIFSNVENMHTFWKELNVWSFAIIILLLHVLSLIIFL